MEIFAGRPLRLPWQAERLPYNFWQTEPLPNFGRVHQTLRATPAMEAGVADHVRTLEEIIALLD